MGDPDDIHNFVKRYENALAQVEKSDISKKNKELIPKFAKYCRKKGNRLSTIAMDINTLRWVAQIIKKDIDSITEEDFDDMIDGLEIKKKNTSNYKKVVKKFFGWIKEGNPPRWIKELRLPQHKTPVQPGDLLEQKEIMIMLDECRHPRDKAFIAVHLDSCMRVGAIGTMRIKSVEETVSGGILYMSTTSRNLKTATPKPIPITWSMGYLRAWLDVHPDKNNPEAPLWVSLKGEKIVAMTYPGLVAMLNRILKRTGLKKKVHFHLFKHQKVTDMIKKGYSDREIRYQASWSANSNHMFDIYGNFYNEDMVNSIYARAGLSPKEAKPVILERCPRCRIPLIPEARVCHQCALVLDSSLLSEVEQKAQEARLLMMDKIFKDPAAMVRFRKLLDLLDSGK
ncbi:MAG: site-specific integrase [Candidatus Methanoperedens sp.]|nr:site-specific integrase [Candidatus Methanoperedens sp.]